MIKIIIYKNELAHRISEKTGASLYLTKAMIDAFTLSVIEALEEGDEVFLMGFGNFEVVETTGRKNMFDVQSKKRMDMPASKRVKFKAGAELSRAAKNSRKVFNELG